MTKEEKLEEALDLALKRLKKLEEIVHRDTIDIEDVWKKYVPQNKYAVRHDLRHLIRDIDENVTSARQMLERTIIDIQNL